MVCLHTGWLVLSGLLPSMVVEFTARVGVWPAPFAIGSKASALRLRAKAQGLSWFVYELGTMVFGEVDQMFDLRLLARELKAASGDVRDV